MLTTVASVGLFVTCLIGWLVAVLLFGAVSAVAKKEKEYRVSKLSLGFAITLLVPYILFFILALIGAGM